MSEVVLSIFGGVGLLDMGFEAAGFCVVKGPDLLWGSDIRNFSAKPLHGKINGVITGVPCHRFSNAVKKANRDKYPDLWGEYWRVVDESQPDWALAECVWGAEASAINMFDCPEGYHLRCERTIFSEFGSAQRRPRLITYASKKPDSFWELLFKHGLKWGREWRKKIGRDVGQCFQVVTGDGVCRTARSAKYATICADSLEQRNSGTGKPPRYIKGEDLLDAFDLPRDWKLPDHARISRGSTARLITQGVPVAAAYALAMAVRKAKDD